MSGEGEGTPTPGGVTLSAAPVDATPEKVQVVFMGAAGKELTRFTMSAERAELARAAWETARAAAHTGRIQTDAAGALLPGMCPLSLCSLRAGGYSVWLPDVAVFIVQGVRPPPPPSTGVGQRPPPPPYAPEQGKPPEPQHGPDRGRLGLLSVTPRPPSELLTRPPQPQESPDQRAENGRRYPTSWADKAAERQRRERAGEGTWEKVRRWLRGES